MDVKFVDSDHQHERFNPLTNQWVLVSPHRLKRPWTGQVEKPEEEAIPQRDPKNPLTPGATRPNGKVSLSFSYSTKKFVHYLDMASDGASAGEPRI